MKTANSRLRCSEQDLGANTFRRNSMRLKKFLTASFCLLFISLSGTAQTSNQSQQGPANNSQRQLAVPLVPRILQQEDKSANTEKSDSPWFKGKARSEEHTSE